MANKSVVVASSGGDYTSLNSAYDTENNNGNLAGASWYLGGPGILNIRCDNFSDTTFAVCTGFTTTSAYYVNTYGNPSDKTTSNNGLYSTSRYRMVKGAGASCITEEIAYCRFIDLQFCRTATPTSDDAHFNTYAGTATSYVLIDKCIFVGYAEESAGSYSSAMQGGWNDNTTIVVRNSLFYKQPSGYRTAAIYAYNNNITIHNCTFVDCSVGVTNSSGTINTTNLGFSSCATPTSGTIATTVTNSSTTPTFIDAGALNYNLASTDTTWHDQGTDLSGTFSYDIADTTRVTWDIGADEYVASGGGTTRTIPTTMKYYRSRRMA